MKKINNQEDSLIFNNSKYSESYQKLANNRIIFFNEEFTKKVSAEITALLLYYDHINHNDITLYINSPGGDAQGLIQIFDVMQLIKSDVSTVCIGKAYSAGGIILTSGAKGKRKALKNSELMIHGVQFSFPLIGENTTSSKDYYEYITHVNNTIMKILSDHTNHSLEKVAEDFKRDMYFSAEEALDYGLIDEII